MHEDGKAPLGHLNRDKYHKVRREMKSMLKEISSSDPKNFKKFKRKLEKKVMQSA